jgi:hypothetical protein
MSTELDEATVLAWLKRSRESQGLPLTISDASILSRVVVLALGPSKSNGKGGNGSAP